MFNFFKGKDNQKPTNQPNQEKTFDWHKNHAHANLLAYFKVPKDFQLVSKFQKWAEPLGEPVEEVVKSFLNSGLLEKADTIDHLLTIHTSAQLRQLLSEKGLVESGTKETLARRLMENDEKRILKLVADHQVLICTKLGRGIADEYELFEKNRKKTALKETEIFLRQANYREAASTMAFYEAECIFARGINVSWDAYDTKRDEVMLGYIFSKTPKILVKRGIIKSENVRITAGMIHLWGSPTYAELNYDEETRYIVMALVSHANFLYQIDNCRNQGEKFISAFTCNDQSVCPACQKVAKIEKYRLKDIPEFPLEDCTCEMGCRCWVG